MRPLPGNSAETCFSVTNQHATIAESLKRCFLCGVRGQNRQLVHGVVSEQRQLMVRHEESSLLVPLPSNDQ
jgi:hypothetical protein